MFSKLTPVAKDTMGKKSLAPLPSYAFAAKETVAPVGLAECMHLFRHYPLVFAAQGEKRIPVALLGLDADTNLWVDARGRWQCPVIPAVFRAYPFALARAHKDDAKTLVLCMDQEQEVLSDTGTMPLFDQDGEPSAMVTKVLHLLEEHNKQTTLATMLGAELLKDDLLQECRVRLAGKTEQEVTLQGFYRIDEAKLNGLEGERFLVYRDKGLLPVIYAHLFSLAHLETLFKLKAVRQQGQEAAGKDQPASVAGSVPDSFHFG